MLLPTRLGQDPRQVALDRRGVRRDELVGRHRGQRLDLEHVAQQDQPEDLAGQLLNDNHQYPDGAVLFLGTMFAPVKDRRGVGLGFTHEIGDRVEISSPPLGRLVNWVDHSSACPPWTFGTGALMRNLAQRGLLRD